MGLALAAPNSQPRVVRLSDLANFKAIPQQMQAYQAALIRKFILFGGAAGGSKSRWLRWTLLLILIHVFIKYGVRDGRVGLFCENYPALLDRQVIKIVKEFPRWLGEVKKTHTEGLAFYLAPEFGGGAVALRNLDDPSKYDSVEYIGIGVDELTKNKAGVFDELRKRLRWSRFQQVLEFEDDGKPGMLPDDFNFPFLGATNPGGIGHAWVKQLWIDRDFPPELKDRADDFVFIKSLATDNPYNPPSYFKDLMSLPEPLRSAYAFGSWDLFVGQFFKEWRRELHVCRPFPIPAYWRRFWAGDWGYAKPFAGGTFAVSPEGRVYLTAEQVWTEKDAPWLGRELARIHEGQNIAFRKLDPSCWDASRGVSIAEQMAAAGWPCEKADNDRQSGWMRVREYLAWEQDKSGTLVREPQLQVFDCCPYTIRTLPSLVFDKHNPEDLDTDGEDHAADKIRYALMSRPGITQIPLEEMPLEYAEALMRVEKREMQVSA